MNEADDETAPPARLAQFLENDDIDKGKQPSGEHVNAEAVQLGAIAIWREDRAPHIRQIHTCETQSLCRFAGGGEDNGRYESPDDPTAPVHVFVALTSEPVCTAGWPLPRSRS